MTYYIYAISWSQTDTDTVIVMSDSKENAYEAVTRFYPGGRYYDLIAYTNTLI